MNPTLTRLGGLTIACAATIAWLVNLLFWESAAEPARPWGDYSAENNTYWARDLRWCVIAAALVGLVCVVRGARRSSTVIGVLGPVWLVIDALLDRADVGESLGRAMIAVVFVAYLVAVSLTVGRPRPLTSGRLLRGTAPDERRGSLVIAAFVAACVAPEAASMQSITDDQRSLVIGASVAGGLLILAALVAATAAGPALSRRRAGALAVAAVAAGGLLATARIAEPHDGGGATTGFASLGLMLVMFAGVNGLRAPWRGIGRLIGVTLLLAVLYAVIGLVIFILTDYTAPVGEFFTGLAGNPAVNSSDTDVINAFLGYSVGLVLGIAIVARRGVDWRALAARANTPQRDAATPDSW